MSKLFRSSKVWNMVKRLMCSLLIGTMLAVSVPSTPTFAQPKSGFLGKLMTFMIKEKIRDNKRNKIEKQRELRKEELEKKKLEREEKKEEAKEQRKKQAEEYAGKFKHLDWEEIVGLNNLVDQMLDGYPKDVTDLSRKKIEARIKARLKNKKLTKRHHKEIEKYIQKRIYLHQIFEHEGEGFVVISPSGAVTFTNPTPVLAY